MIRPAKCVFRVGSGETAGKVDAVPRLPVGDGMADCGHYAGSVVSGRVGERRECGIGSAADVGIDRIDSGSMDFDENFSWAGSWSGEFFEDEIGCGAKGVKAEGFHGVGMMGDGEMR